MEGRIVRVGEDLGELPEGGKVVIGFDDCLFKGDVEGALVRVMIGDWMRENCDLSLERVFPKWFQDLIEEYKDSEGAPGNYGEILDLFARLKQRIGERIINGDKIPVINDVCRLDEMLFEWVRWFFAGGVSQKFFVERARWFDGVSPEALAGTVGSLVRRGGVLPELNRDVVRLIEGVRVGREVHLVTGTIGEAVRAVLAAHERLAEQLGLSDGRIHASSRGRSAGKMRVSGARAMHPKAKADLMGRIGGDVRLAVLAMRNCQPPDPVAAKVLANGGVVVGV